MKTNKRRFLAALTASTLALTPCFAAGTMTAFAADYDITVNNTVADYSYTAYKIFAGDFNVTKLSNVTWATDFNGDALITALKADALLGSVFASVTDAASVAEKLPDLSGDETKLAQFAKLAYANKGSTKSFISTYNSTEGSERYTIPATEAGYYLVEETSVPTGKVTSRYMLKVAGPTEVSPKRPSPTLTKVITSPDPKDSGKANNVSIGDAVTYTLTSAVPDMTGYDKYFFVINDTLASGLTFNNNVAITIGGETVLPAKYEVQTGDAAGGNTFQIVFKDFYNEWKSDAGDTIIVTYSATLNENADRTTVGNLNTANLTYSNNPNVVSQGESTENPDEPKPPTGTEPGDPVGKTPDEQTKTYTANIKLTKIDGASTSTPKGTLTGAKFRLSGTTANVVLVNGTAYQKDASGTYYKLKDGTFTTTAPDDNEDLYDGTDKYKIVTNVSSSTTYSNICMEAFVKSDGTLEFGGLGAGTYTIEEIVTPAGYNSIAPMTIKIDGDGNTFSAPNWSAKKNNEDITMTDTATVAFDVVNNAGSTLPETGGMGTKLFYVFGSLFVIGGATFMVTKKRVGNSK